MSAEQMRVELESFVNKGLRDGLKGWPVKTASTPGAEGCQTYCSTSTAAALFHGAMEGPLLVAGPDVAWEQSPITSDIRSIMNFWGKCRFGVTADGIAPLY